MAGAYLVTLAATDRPTVKNGVTAVSVWAEDATDAKAAAQAQGSGGASDAAWTAATATAAAAVADLEGWRLRLVLTGATVIDVTVTGTPADTLDDIGDLMVIALNATALIANSAYATPALTISSIADGIGDYTVEAFFMPPLADADWEQPTVSFPSFLGAIVDGGIAGAALTIQLVPGSASPALLGRLSST